MKALRILGITLALPLAVGLLGWRIVIGGIEEYYPPGWHPASTSLSSAVDSLSATILRFQGNGDHAGVVAWMERYGQVSSALRADLDRLGAAGIPVDVIFEQGEGVLGL